jgi:hypothetical protein
MTAQQQIRDTVAPVKAYGQQCRGFAVAVERFTFSKQRDLNLKLVSVFLSEPQGTGT